MGWSSACRWPRRCWRLVVVVGIAGTTVVAGATPAFAHGPGGAQPRNYQTRVLRVRPAVANLELRAVDVGARLELENRTGRDMLVLGYDDEPYLRVGPDGVFENRRSPATYLNRTHRNPPPPPARADPSAAPVWRKISDEPIARWHDHRVHWMGRDDPPAVRRDPNRTQVIQRWTLTVRQGATTITATGDVRWVPGPSPWPWVLGALTLAVSLVLASWTRSWHWICGVALAALAVVGTVHLAAGWGATTSPVSTRLGASAYLLAAVALTLLALGTLALRGNYTAGPMVLLAGIFVALAGGAADIQELSRSQLPSTIDPDQTRAIVTTLLGAGLGLAAAEGIRLFRHRPHPQPAASRGRLVAATDRPEPPPGSLDGVRQRTSGAFLGGIVEVATSRPPGCGFERRTALPSRSCTLAPARMVMCER